MTPIFVGLCGYCGLIEEKKRLTLRICWLILHQFIRGGNKHPEFEFGKLRRTVIGKLLW